MNIPQGDRVARDNHRVSTSRRSVNKVSQGCRRRSGVFHYGQGLRVLETSSATGFAAMKGEMKRVQKTRKRQVWNAAEPRWRGAVRTRQTDAVVQMSGELSNFLTGSHRSSAKTASEGHRVVVLLFGSGKPDIPANSPRL